MDGGPNRGDAAHEAGAFGFLGVEELVAGLVGEGADAVEGFVGDRPGGGVGELGGFLDRLRGLPRALMVLERSQRGLEGGN